MEERTEDEDRDVSTGLSSLPPHRKAHSYSQQLRPTSTQNSHQQFRKHSLDEKRTPINTGSFYNSYDDDDDFFPGSSTSHIAGGNVDDLLQSQPLPEFLADGSGKGIFKVPIRSAVHPGRPPYLELRPHPLRETQAGKFLRNIACTESQLWAGQESGLRVWEFHNAFESGCGLGGRVRRGDEDAVPFYESADTSPIMCLAVDHGNRLVWSGHKDGKIRSWKMDQSFSNAFKEGLSWQAHKGPVHAMVISSYGN